MRRYRDAATGEFVDEAYALAHPDTTIAEEIAETDLLADLEAITERLERMEATLDLLLRARRAILLREHRARLRERIAAGGKHTDIDEEIAEIEAVLRMNPS